MVKLLYVFFAEVILRLFRQKARVGKGARVAGPAVGWWDRGNSLLGQRLERGGGTGMLQIALQMQC